MSVSGQPLVPFDLPLCRGRLIRRYKRFLADVEFEDGRIATVHTPNTGSMKTCSDPGSEVIVSDSGNPKRKLPLTLELVRVAPGEHGWAGVNTSLPNRLVAAAIEAGMVSELTGYARLRREVNVEQGSRLDLMLTDGPGGGRCLVEVKNVTMVSGRAAVFPDAVTERGRRHLQVLARAVERGERAVIFFLVQRPDCEVFSTADSIDPAYGETLREVTSRGVELLAYRSVLGLDGARIESGPMTYVPAPELGGEK
ncbi:MAG: DNA/RNA nuclease SfsA [Candidatus Glassbacteria bacterium]|nr:DNA/RNA nuclease SfsA [Candidatus Glassbacteria bacterium]